MLLLLIHVCILTVFTIVYKMLPGGMFSNADPSWVDCLYFAASTHTTVGYGDLTPKSPVAKLTATAHMLIVFAIIISSFTLPW
nr:potassium channel protein kcv [Acanthocystis turfacea Chlorella virus Island-Lake_Medium]